MIVCSRRLQFCAGHRVYRHESKCAHLHGHNYVVIFHATAPQLDEIGRVIDFSELKNRLGRWIENNWDHGFVLYKEDKEAIEALKNVRGQKIHLLETNPTAENMAEYLLRVVAPEQLGGTHVTVNKVVLWETENAHVEVSQ
ncbi:MAG TPA: 6-carboxytetrahydropterin synthase [Pyrinomonadaceae bacterium]|jgi:6-pyruvoyltetrahydropterin/6-carboxytetrahydropterin synthase|nr:6-carboxytetrahydropterin synthase [Pyrinomonadaceae bacterium]